MSDMPKIPDMLDMCDELDRVIESIVFLEDVVHALITAKHDHELSEKGLSGLHHLLGNIIQRTKAVADSMDRKIHEEGCVP